MDRLWACDVLGPKYRRRGRYAKPCNNTLLKYTIKSNNWTDYEHGNLLSLLPSVKQTEIRQLLSIVSCCRSVWASTIFKLQAFAGSFGRDPRCEKGNEQRALTNFGFTRFGYTAKLTIKINNMKKANSNFFENLE
jgi:hypothetical protein